MGRLPLLLCALAACADIPVPALGDGGLSADGAQVDMILDGPADAAADAQATDTGNDGTPDTTLDLIGESLIESGVDSAPIDGDSDGFTSDVDCDDTNPNIHPGAREIPYDGVDSDCDGNDILTLSTAGNAVLGGVSVGNINTTTKLISWIDVQTGGSVFLRTRLLSANTTLGPQLTVHSLGATDNAETVTLYDGQNFFVGWMQGQNNSREIWARLVQGDGSATIGQAVQLNGPAEVRSLSGAASTTDYLLAWHEDVPSHPTTPSQLFHQFIPVGNLGAAQAKVPDLLGSAGILMQTAVGSSDHAFMSIIGSSFLRWEQFAHTSIGSSVNGIMSASTTNYRNDSPVDIAHGGGRFMMTYLSNDSGSDKAWIAQLVDNFPSSPTEVVPADQLNVGAGVHSKPAITFCAGLYHVVYQGNQGGQRRVHRHMVSADGTSISAAGVLFQLPAGFPINNMVLSCYAGSPLLAFSGPDNSGAPITALYHIAP